MPRHPSLLHSLELSQALARFPFVPSNSGAAGVRRSATLSGLAQNLQMPRILRRAPMRGRAFVSQLPGRAGSVSGGLFPGEALASRPDPCGLRFRVRAERRLNDDAGECAGERAPRLRVARRSTPRLLSEEW